MRVRPPPSARFSMDSERSSHPIEELTWCSDLSYAIGLITTDGNLSSDGRHISLTSSDTQQLRNFKKCLGTNAKLALNAPGSFSRNPSYRVQLSNTGFYWQLLAIGLLPRKTSLLGALSIPQPFFRDFLRGVIDGDGSIILASIPLHQVIKLVQFGHGKPLNS